MTRYALALLSVSLLAAASGCTGPAGGQGATALVRLVAEGAGANCSAGGTTVLAGVDLNRDGILQDSEVTSTSHVCSGPQRPPCTTLEGSLTIRNAADWTALVDSGCTTLTGDLVFDANGMVATTGAPALAHIGGTVWVQNEQTLRAIDLPSLASIGGDLLLIGNKALTQVGLDALESVGGDITLNDNVKLTGLGLGRLATVTGSVMLSANDVLTNPVLGALATVGGDFSLLLNPELNPVLPALASVGGSVNVTGIIASAQVNLPALTMVGVDLTVMSSPGIVSLDLSKLGSVPGTLSISGEVLETLALSALSDVGNLTISDNLVLRALDLTALATTTGSLHISGNLLLPAIDLPALTTTTDSFNVSSNPALTELRAPILASVGILIISFNQDLPQCQAEALLNRLVGLGFAGISQVTDNNATATCPP